MIALWLLASSAFAADGVVEGVVLDGDRYRPIAGATVTVDIDGDDDPSTVTAGDGSFRVFAPPGRWPVIVTLQSGSERTVGPVRVVGDAATEVLVSWLVSWPPVVSIEEPEAPAEQEATAVAAVPGRITGQLIDEEGEPVAGGRVFVRGQAIEALSDKDGRFVLDVPVGTYDLSVLRSGFATRTIPGVEATEDGAEPIVVGMVPAGLAMETLNVTVPRITGGAAGLLEERRQSSGVSELLGAEQMKKSGDANAAAALRRVTGLTVVGGRFVFIRGLGGRYSATLLNGSMLPSPEPEQRTVPLDLFPTSVLESVVIDKTFTPDRTAEFAGGVVKIRTRAVPSEPILQIAGSFGGSTGATFLTAKEGYRSATDALGFGLSDRALPGAISALGDQPVTPRDIINPDGLSDEEIGELGRAMPNRWALRDRLVLPDGSLQFAWGDGWKIPGKAGPRIGAMLSAYWSSNWNLDDGFRKVFGVGQEDAPLEVRRDTSFRVLNHRVQLGGIGVFGLSWGKDHEIVSTTLLNRISDHTAGTYFADDPTSDIDLRQIESIWTEQQMLYEQVRGRHVMPAAYPAEIEWRYAYASAKRDEPERLMHRYVRGQDGTYFAASTGTWNEINYGDLRDNLHEGGLDLKLPFLLGLERPGFVKAGFSVMRRARTANLRRFAFDTRGVGLDVTAPMDQLASQENIGPQGEDDADYMEFRELLVSTDDYRATQTIDAGYVMTEVPFLTRFRLMAGARLEAGNQTVETLELFSQTLEPISTTLDNLDVLPASTLTIGIGPKAKPDSMLLRLGYGRTLSRPEFRELAPILFIEPTTGVVIFGNEGLTRAVIDNVDLRWEWYFKPGESLSVAGFFKNFTDPIERVARPIAGSNTSQTLRNAEGARNFGAEIDFRVGLEDLHPTLRDVFVAGNAAYIDSRITLSEAGETIDTNPKRPLEGQSPWVVNAQLGYDNPDLGLSVALLYNVFGPRIIDVGQQGIPDTYELPFHRLDFVAIIPIPKGFQLQVRANNMLDSAVRLRVGDEIAGFVKPGASFRLGLQWNR